MTTPSPLSQDKVHLWLLEHRQTDGHMLSQEERLRSARYRTEVVRERFLFTQTAKREILGHYLNQPPQEILFQTNEYGKPFVDGLEFSISHTDGMSLLALSELSPVGIDIELLTPQPDLDLLLTRICSPSEKEEFKALTEAQKLKAFYRLWTAKEAYLKNLGIGFKVDPQAVESNFPALTLLQALDLPQLQLLEVDISPDFIAHLASKQRDIKHSLFRF